jgi:hypothetical protein
MASNIKYPDEDAVWYIEGDKLALLTNVDSEGDTRTNTKGGRKLWKAIAESVTDGLLLHYHGEPNSVKNLIDEPDIDNSLHLFIVDYVKCKLFMDRSATAPAEEAQRYMALSNMHERKWKDALVKFGGRKRDKTGGSRVLIPFNLR